MTGAELEAIIARGESERVEFKSNANDAEAPRIAVRALANDLSYSGVPGYLAIGIDDAGRPTELETNDATLQKIAHIRSNATLNLRHLRLRSQIASMSIFRFYEEPFDE